jgi:HK97 gp10 family phage protein
MGRMSDDNSDFDAYLNNLPDKIVAELSSTIREQGEMLSAAQKQALQSLEDTEPTGGLVESCVALPTDDPLTYIVQAGGDLTTKEIREGSGINYDYAEAFEFGTSRQHAKPFFWPTYRAKRQGIVDTINQAIEKALK